MEFWMNQKLMVAKRVGVGDMGYISVTRKLPSQSASRQEEKLLVNTLTSDNWNKNNLNEKTESKKREKIFSKH